MRAWCSGSWGGGFQGLITFCTLQSPSFFALQSAVVKVLQYCKKDIITMFDELPAKYKAVIYDEPGKISTKVVELDMPEPAAGDVLIKL